MKVRAPQGPVHGNFFFFLIYINDSTENVNLFVKFFGDDVSVIQSELKQANSISHQANYPE